MKFIQQLSKKEKKECIKRMKEGLGIKINEV